MLIFHFAGVSSEATIGIRNSHARLRRRMRRRWRALFGARYLGGRGSDMLKKASTQAKIGEEEVCAQLKKQAW